MEGPWLDPGPPLPVTQKEGVRSRVGVAVGDRRLLELHGQEAGELPGEPTAGTLSLTEETR